MTDVLLISVQSSFLLVPPGSQLWHHVTAKVTLCLGCLLEEQTGPASRSTNRPHIRGTESQTHYKLDCDYSGKPTQSIPNTLTQRSCFHYPIAFFFSPPIFLYLRSFQTRSNVFLYPVTFGPWIVIIAIWKWTFKSIIINNFQQRYQAHRTWCKNKQRWVFLGFILAFFKKKNLSSFLKFISNYSSFSPTAAGNGSSPNFFPSLASSAAFRILFHLYFPILVQNS